MIFPNPQVTFLYDSVFASSGSAIQQISLYQPEMQFGEST